MNSVLCVLPGCTNRVADVGEPCGDCVRAFGPMLRRNPNGQRMTAGDIAERDSYTHRHYQLQHMLRKEP
ncbi:hypothetical protein MSM1_20230 [Mycobacterium sp. SM1]|nr:hypothetical protein [Mycobacterium sp. SM1]